MIPHTREKHGAQSFVLGEPGRRWLADLEGALSNVVSGTLDQNSPGRGQQTTETKSDQPAPAEPLTDEQRRIQRWERDFAPVLKLREERESSREYAR